MGHLALSVEPGFVVLRIQAHAPAVLAEKTGLTGLLIPEDLGGSGMAMADLQVVLVRSTIWKRPRTESGHGHANCATCSRGRRSLA